MTQRTLLSNSISKTSKSYKIFFEFLKEHTQKLKYIGGVIFLISIIVTTKTYINYLTIQETIQNTKNAIKQKEEKIAYTENFLLSYHNSEYRDYFFSHKNSILFPGEKIIKLKKNTTQKNQENRKKEKQKNNFFSASKSSDLSNQDKKLNHKQAITPSEAWSNFLKEKWEKL